MPILVKEDVTVSPESQNQGPLAALWGKRKRRWKPLLLRLPSLSSPILSHPVFPPPSLQNTWLLWRLGQEALHLPDLEMQGLGLGDLGGEVFWLEDLE